MTIEFKIPKDEILATNEMVESGAYFAESMKWYNDMFLSSFISRMAYFIFFITYGVSVYFAFVFGMALFPLKETKEMIIFNNRDSDTFVTKHHLNTFDTPAKNILSVILQNYVTQREQYRLDGDRPLDVIRNKTNFIRRYSSQKIFIDFRDEINITGGRGDRFMTDGTETKIQITGFDFIYEEKSIIGNLVEQFIPTDPPKKAYVQFMINNQKRVAYINYIFELPLVHAKGKDAEIKLTVIDYSVKKAT